MYGPIFFASLGANPVTIIVLNLSGNLVLSVVMLVLVDRIGRRPLLMSDAFIQAAGLLIMGVLGSAPQRSGVVFRGIIAAMLIFSMGYTAA